MGLEHISQYDLDNSDLHLCFIYFAVRTTHSMSQQFKNNSKYVWLLLASLVMAGSGIFTVNWPVQSSASNTTTESTAPTKSALPNTNTIDHVILISVDGLRPEALLPPIVDQYPAMQQLTQGAWTAQARCDPDSSITLPNHVDMLTGRLLVGEHGHGWVSNSDPPSRKMGGSLHLKADRYISSVFDVAHDAGMQTAMIAGKWKFVLFGQSYGEDAGGPDGVAPNDGQNKIDCFIHSSDLMTQVEQLVAFINVASQNQKRSFTFLHLALPDFTGHGAGWDLNEGSSYRKSLQRIDQELASLLSKIQQSQSLAGRVAIVLTSDHGGGVPFTSHTDPEAPINFTIPFMVWSGVNQKPVDLYLINKVSRHCPGANERFTPNQLPPIRNADAANVCLTLLGLPPVPGSTVNARQELLVALPQPK